MDDTKSANQNSLSFVIYSALAASLWCVYYGFTQFINALLRYHILDPDGASSLFDRGFYNPNLSDVATLLLLGGGLFGLYRTLEKRAFDTGALHMDARVRVWLLRLMMVATGSSVLFDLWHILRTALSGESDLSGTLCTITTLLGGALLLLFLTRAAKGRIAPQKPLTSSLDLSALGACLVTVILCVWISPPSLLKDLREDQTTAGTLLSVIGDLNDFKTRAHALPASLDEAAKTLIQREHYTTDLTRDLAGTKKVVSYTLVSPATYKLCATFKRNARELRLLGGWRLPGIATSPFGHFAPGLNCQIIKTDTPLPEGAQPDLSG